MLNKAWYTAYTEVLTLTVPFAFPYIWPVQWKQYKKTVSWWKTARLLVLSCSRSSLPTYKENLSYHSSCVCLQVLFSRSLSFLQSCSLKIFISILQDAECSWEKPVVLLHTLSHSPERELSVLWSCGTWPHLSPTVFLDCLNLKHVTAWMTGSLLYLLSPGYGPCSWKAFIEINAFMEKRCSTHRLIYSTVKSNSSGAEDNCVPFHIHIHNIAAVDAVGPQRLGIAHTTPGYLILT